MYGEINTAVARHINAGEPGDEAAWEQVARDVCKDSDALRQLLFLHRYSSVCRMDLLPHSSVYDGYDPSIAKVC